MFIPVLCRYEDSNGNQAVFLNAGKKPDDCKMVAKALFSFQVRKREEGRELVCTVSVVQAQNNRELAFRKGDIIYVKKQVDNNWYEGERNAAIGIFPVSYVEILPSNTDVSRPCVSLDLTTLFSQVSTLSKKEKNYEGTARAKFNFTAQTPMELSLIKGNHRRMSAAGFTTGVFSRRDGRSHPEDRQELVRGEDREQEGNPARLLRRGRV